MIAFPMRFRLCRGDWLITLDLGEGTGRACARGISSRVPALRWLASPSRRPQRHPNEQAQLRSAICLNYQIPCLHSLDVRWRVAFPNPGMCTRKHRAPQAGTEQLHSPVRAVLLDTSNPWESVPHEIPNEQHKVLAWELQSRIRFQMIDTKFLPGNFSPA